MYGTVAAGLSSPPTLMAPTHTQPNTHVMQLHTENSSGPNQMCIIMNLLLIESCCPRFELDRFRSETKCGTNVDHQAHLRAILPTTATGLPTTSATSTTGRTRSWRRAGTSGRERERPSQRRYRHLRGEVLGPRCAPTGTTPRSKPRCEPYNLLPYASASNVSDWPQLGCNQ